MIRSNPTELKQATPCDSCNEMMEPTEVKTVLEIEGNFFHKTCMTCFLCNKSLQGIFVKNEGRHICLRDYTKLFSKKKNFLFFFTFFNFFFTFFFFTFFFFFFLFSFFLFFLIFFFFFFFFTFFFFFFTFSFFLKKNVFFSRLDDRCNSCFCPINENESSLFKLNKYWHVQHFQCGQCNAPLNDEEEEKIFEKFGDKFCSKCFEKIKKKESKSKK